MSAHSETWLSCDEPGCLHRTPAVLGDHTRARKRQAERGWTFSPINGDRCPEHAKETTA